MNPGLKISREKLYQEIWKNNVKKTAEKYNLNYSKLCSSCHKNNIPIPSSKYWMNLRMGRSVSDLIVPLPESEDKYLYLEYKDLRTSNSGTEDRTGASNCEDSKNKSKSCCYSFDPEEIRTRLMGLNDNSKVEQIINLLENWQPSNRKILEKPVLNYKKKVAQYKKNKNSVYFSGGYYYDEAKDKIRNIDKIASSTLPRLYKLLSLLAYIFQQLGAMMTDDASIRIGDDLIEFEVVEGQDKVPHQITKEEKKELKKYEEEKIEYDWVTKPRIRKWDHPYNGKLRIHFLDYGVKFFIKDNKNQKLEDQLPKIITYFYQAYIIIRKERKDREECERRWQEAEKRKERQRQLEDEENKRVKNLYNLVDDYRLAKDIREMAKELKEQGRSEDQIQWMLDKADWIDPVIEKEDDVLGKREHEKKEKPERINWFD